MVCSDSHICEHSGDGNVALAFAISIGAGLATTIGALLTFIPWIRLNNTQWLAYGLAASAGVMLYVSFVEIFPTSINYFCCVAPKHKMLLGTIFFFVGIIATVLLDIILHWIGEQDNKNQCQQFYNKFCSFLPCFNNNNHHINNNNKFSSSISSSGSNNNLTLSTTSETLCEELTHNSTTVDETATRKLLRGSRGHEKNQKEEEKEEINNKIFIKNSIKDNENIEPNFNNNNIEDEDDEEIEEQVHFCNEKDINNTKISFIGNESIHQLNNSIRNKQHYSSTAKKNSHYKRKKTQAYANSPMSASSAEVLPAPLSSSYGTLGPTPTASLPSETNNNYDPDSAVPSKERLKHMGILTGIAIALHNFPEGIATFVATLADAKVGLGLAIAITFHNIPEGIAVALPVYYATGHKGWAFFWAFLSGISEPIGALLAWLILKDVFGPTTYAILFGFIAGMMTHISLHELIPMAFRLLPPKETGTVSFFLVIGMAVMACSLVIFDY